MLQTAYCRCAVMLLGSVLLSLGSLAAQDTIRVNFAAPGAALPDGWQADHGAAYGPRSSGLHYGWNGDNSGTTRERGSSRSPDVQHDTLIHLQKPALPHAAWEIALPVGRYAVTVLAGDASHTDSHYRLAVEGVLALDHAPSSQARWATATVVVQVVDGRLTIDSAPGAANNKLCAVQIEALPAEVPGERLAGLRWARHLAGPLDALTPYQVAADGTLESATVVDESADGTRLRLTQWMSDSQAGTRAWSGNTLIADPGSAWSVGLRGWENTEAVDTGAGWIRVARMSQDAHLRLGYSGAQRDPHPAIHGDTKGFSGPQAEDAIVLALAFRRHTGSGLSRWQQGYYSGIPVQMGVWQVPAGSSLSQAQANQANRLATLDVLAEISPDAPFNVEFNLGESGHWHIAVDLNGDGQVDVDLAAGQAGALPSTLQVDMSGGLILSATPAGGTHPGRVGITSMDLHLRPGEGLRGLAAAGHGAWRVNFARPDTLPISGWLKDSGAPLGEQDGGLIYGWNGDNSATTRERGSSRSPDLQHDTLIHLQKSSLPHAVWEMAVPNGAYRVQLLAGDPSHTDSVYAFTVEDQLAMHETPTSAERWAQASIDVQVDDGFLTVAPGPGAKNTKLASLVIESLAQDLRDRRPLRLDAAHASRVSPALITGEAWDDQRIVTIDPVVSFDRFSSGRFLARVPLDPVTAVTTFTAIQEGQPDTVVDGVVQWLPTVISDGGQYTIRRGESLLLVADSGYADGATVLLDPYGQGPQGSAVQTVADDQAVAVSYDDLGTYTVAIWSDTQADAPMATCTVAVVEFALPSYIPVQVGFTRNLLVDAGHLSASALTLAPATDAALALGEPETSDHAFSTTLRAEANNEPVLEAYLATSEGPLLLDSVAVATFNLTSPTATVIPVRERYPDGSLRLGGQLHMAPLRPDLDITLRVFRTGASYADGGLSLTIPSNEFTTHEDGSGGYIYDILLSAGTAGGPCHNRTVWHGVWRVGR